MPWLIQMLGFALFLLAIGLALWLSLWLLVILFVVGLTAVAFTRLRNYLTAKGILNPTPGIPPHAEQSMHVTIVEGDFERVEPLSHNKD